MTKPTVSIIMLTYNREQLVSRALESILAQSFRNYEFIIVDNGSTDQSGQIADQYAQQDSRIHVIHKERGNIGSGRNAGLDVAIGKYIAFIDDDDWCESDFLAFLLNLAIENNADVAVCGSTGKEYDEKKLYEPEDALIELFWRKRFNVQFPTKLIKRSLFDGIRFSDTSAYDDIELMPLMLANANLIAYHGIAKYTFYRHDGNNSAWTTHHELIEAATLAEYLAIYKERTIWLCERFPDNAAYWRYFEWSFQMSMTEKVTRLQLADCYTLRDQMVTELLLHRSEFLNCPWILDFESEWMKEYV
jgi:glycosyltransferase involved in cell wall biosynthesis